MSEPQWLCDLCDEPADWAFIGEGGDMFLCDAHGHAAEGWVRVSPSSETREI